MCSYCVLVLIRSIVPSRNLELRSVSKNAGFDFSGMIWTNLSLLSSSDDCLSSQLNPNLCTVLSRRYERRRSLHILALPEPKTGPIFRVLRLLAKRREERTTFPFQSPGENRRGRREIPRDKRAPENPLDNCPKQNGAGPKTPHNLAISTNLRYTSTIFTYLRTHWAACS